MTLNIYTTLLNRNQLHIGTERGYLGTVEIDTNSVSRFFNKTRGQSMDVVFGDKTVTVNKDSYYKLLISLTAKTADKIERSAIHKFAVFSEAVNLEKAPVQKPMRVAIGKVERLRLFKKLANAIDNDETDKALKYAYCGADLHLPFYDREFFGIAFISPTENLPSNKTYEVGVFKGSPLMHAARKANTVLVKALHKLEGLNMASLSEKHQAESYTLDKHTTKGVKKDEFAISPGVSVGTSAGVELSLGTEVRTSTETTLAEEKTKKVYYQLGQDLTLVRVLA
jgi:hypothetical protein